MNTPDTTQTPQLMKVKLIKDGLTDQGKPRKTGDEIEVTEQQRAFLIKEGFIADPENAPAADASKAAKSNTKSEA